MNLTRPEHPTPRHRRYRLVAGLSSAVLVVAATTGGLFLLQPTAPKATHPAARISATPVSTPSPTPTAVPAPPKPSQAELAAAPLAFYDGVIPSLLDGTTVTPVNQWQIATPLDPLTALYARSDSAATPIAALGSTVPTVKTPTAVAVYGTSGDMILISTPSRRVVPTRGAPAESATFAWARKADFTIVTAVSTVMVDNATSVISIVDRYGTVSTSEVARLGTPQDPTPAATSTYIESIYSESVTSYTRGNPISLTGAHSATLASFGGNSALNAIHYYPSGGNSHGCVRVSAAMTQAMATLPVGTPVVFR